VPDVAAIAALREAALAELAGLRGADRYPVQPLPAPGDPARPLWVGELAGAMTELALDWFAGSGCTGVDALALPGARATKNFFEENGFTARLLVVHRRLDGRAGGR